MNVDPREVPNNENSAISIASDQGFRGPMCAMLAGALPQCLDVIAHISDQGFLVAATWDDYQRLLDLFDRRRGPEPEGPHADLTDEEPLVDWRDQGRAMFAERVRALGQTVSTSDRTERRRRSVRRSEVNAIIARDGRANVDSAVRRVASKRTAGDDRWLKMCDACAQPFEARRDDARFCSNRCRVASSRRATP